MAEVTETESTKTEVPASNKSKSEGQEITKVEQEQDVIPDTPTKDSDKNEKPNIDTIASGTREKPDVNNATIAVENPNSNENKSANTNGSNPLVSCMAQSTESEDNLPIELTALFQPLFCKLCQVQLSSNVVAKTHYDSKNHEKKVRKFLIDYSERTGEPLHKKARIENSKKRKEEDKDPKYFYCEACDLPLTGKISAEQHYMGKNHQNIISGKKMRRITVKPKLVKAEVLKRGDDFGMDFVANCKTPRYTEPAPSGAGYRCEICDIAATSEIHLDMHFKGAKHMKKLKHLNMDTGNLPVSPNDTILASVTSPDQKPVGGDLSVYRTPSGYYYCKTCNLTLNSELQFKQHLGSKKHAKKSELAKVHG